MSLDSNVVNTANNTSSAVNKDLKYFCHICDATVDNVEETDDGSFRCLTCGGMKLHNNEILVDFDDIIVNWIDFCLVKQRIMLKFGMIPKKIMI